MSRTLWFARHGNRYDFVNTEYFSVAARPYDPPLSSEGLLQARELALRLRRETVRAVFCSPYLRTVQTAAPVAEALGLPLYLEAGLGEWLNPEWMRSQPRLMSATDLQRHYPCIDTTYASYRQPQYPEVDASAVGARLGQTLGHLLTHCPGNLAIIGHAVGAAAIAAALKIAPPAALDPSPCSLLQFVEDCSRWQLALAGDTSHLSHPGVTIG